MFKNKKVNRCKKNTTYLRRIIVIVYKIGQHELLEIKLFSIITLPKIAKSSLKFINTT